MIAFSDRPTLLEGFTGDFGALERALIALRADRGTALYDATVYGLFQFSGVRGRKAMVVLTDGEDNASQDLATTACSTTRSAAGVTIYTIGDRPADHQGHGRARSSRQLARATGGEAFFLQPATSLAPVYETINRELRSQYLLTYTSDSETPRRRRSARSR